MEPENIFHAMQSARHEINNLEMGIYELARKITEDGISFLTLQGTDMAYLLMKEERATLPRIQLYEEQRQLLTDAIRKIEKEVWRV